MLKGNPYISASNATINAEKAPSDRQSCVVRGRVKLSPPPHSIGRVVIQKNVFNSWWGEELSSPFPNLIHQATQGASQAQATSTINQDGRWCLWQSTGGVPIMIRWRSSRCRTFRSSRAVIDQSLSRPGFRGHQVKTHSAVAGTSAA